MLARPLIKLIDASILPAATLISAKLLGVILGIFLTRSNWGIAEYTNTIWTSRTAVDLNNLIAISTFSDLVLIILLSIGTGIAVWMTRNDARLNNSSNISNLIDLTEEFGTIVNKTLEWHYRVFFWAVFLAGGAVTVWLNIFLGKTHGLVGVLGTIAAIVLTVLLLQETYGEILTAKSRIRSQKIY